MPTPKSKIVEMTSSPIPIGSEGSNHSPIVNAGGGGGSSIVETGSSNCSITALSTTSTTSSINIISKAESTHVLTPSNIKIECIDLTSDDLLAVSPPAVDKTPQKRRKRRTMDELLADEDTRYLKKSMLSEDEDDEFNFNEYLPENKVASKSVQPTSSKSPLAEKPNSARSTARVEDYLELSDSSSSVASLPVPSPRSYTTCMC